MTKKLAIYIHIPFCISKCSYCAFNSFVASDYDKQKYFQELSREISIRSELFKDYVVTSIYFGGGTPSCVDTYFIEQVMSQITYKFTLAQNVEVSIEVNPNSVDYKKLRTYYEIGINRISFGVQSLNNKTLKTIGRAHLKNDVINAIKSAKKLNFNNINADLLIGLPKQTKSRLISDAKTLIDLGVNHISAYMLQLEDGTKLKNQVDSGKIKLPSEDNCVKMYNKLFKFLKHKKFYRYEVSNFSKKTFECKHNISYWNFTEYLGLGLSAHSFYKGKRIVNTGNIKEYNIENYIESEEDLTIAQQREEFVMLSLRLSRGLDIEEYKNRFNAFILDEKADEIAELKELGLIIVEKGFIRVSDNGFGVLNSIILKLI